MISNNLLSLVMLTNLLKSEQLIEKIKHTLLISTACVALHGLETSIMRNMLKEVSGTGLHVLSWKRGQNSHMRPHISSYSQENEEEDHTNTLYWC